MTTSGPTDGLLLVDKEPGITSHDVVQRARRALKEKRIGHAGTLDPFATGLLVLLVGRATRLLPHLENEPKVYEATIRFGTETDTLDLDGEVVATAPLPTERAVRDAIPALTGRIMQLPPAYSAKRVGGRRAYDLARAGEEVVLAPVPVVVHEWKILEWRGDTCDVEVSCGGGTYIRSLARDLGRAAGSVAHLTALRRTRSGPFDVRDAISSSLLSEGGVRLLPPQSALPTVPVETVPEPDVVRVRRGLDVAASVAGERAVLLEPAGGRMLAFAERRGARWQPRVVLRDA